MPLQILTILCIAQAKLCEIFMARHIYPCKTWLNAINVLDVDHNEDKQATVICKV